MLTFVVDGTPKVAAMKLDNIGEFVRVPAKGNTNSRTSTSGTSSTSSTKADTTSKVPDGDR